MNLLNNNGEFAGQTIFHTHIHLIPRYDENDGYDMKWIARDAQFGPDDLAKIANNIQKEI